MPALAAPALQQSSAIDYGDSVEDRVTNDRGDRWTFSGREGDEVWIEMTSDEIDTYLELLDPDGNVVTENDDAFGTNSLIEDTVLLESGRYTIVARSYDGERGAYTLSLELTDSDVVVGDGGGNIRYGETVSGRVTTESGDEWVFSGREGDEVRIEMSSGTMDTYLELYSLDGEYLTENDDDSFSTNSLIEGYVLPYDEMYLIVASGFGGGTGRYSLSLERTDSGVDISNGGRISYGETVRGRTMSSLGDEWTFSARTGDVVTIYMQSDTMDTYLTLLDPDGFVIAEDDDGGGGTNSLIDNYWLPDSGTYTIVAGEFSGLPGTYQLSLDRENRGGGGGLNLGVDNTLLVGGGVVVGLLCLVVVAVVGVVVGIMLGRQQRDE